MASDTPDIIQSPDPTRQPWLSLDEALCWIAFRWEEGPPDHAAYRRAFDAAEQALKEAAAAGRVPARGEAGDSSRPFPGMMPAEIPADAFWKRGAGLIILDGGKLGAALSDPFDTSYAGPYFYCLRFGAAEILREWPPVAASETGTNPPAVESSPSLSRPETRPVFTPEHARGWYRLRVAGWRKGTAPPSELDDLAAMRAAHEGRISRDFIRNVRRELAPLEWRKSGPRKPR